MAKNLILTENETATLEQHGAVELVRNGFNILVEKNEEWEASPFIITIINPYENVKCFKCVKTLYRYGMLHSRGYGIGCQPLEGLIRHFKIESKEFYDEIGYSRKLSEKEVYNYDLKYIGSEVYYD